MKCCDLNIIASHLGQCGREFSPERVEETDCTFFHYSRSYRCISNDNFDSNVRIRTSKATIAQLARKHCPITASQFEYFKITCENLPA